MGVLGRHGQTLDFAFVVFHAFFSVILIVILRLARISLVQFLREILVSVLFRYFQQRFN